MKPIMIIAGGACFFALVVPQLSPDGPDGPTPVDDGGITIVREKDGPKTSYRSAVRTKAKAKRQNRRFGRFCDVNGDIDPDQCEKARYSAQPAPRVASKRRGPPPPKKAKKSRGGRSVFLERDAAGHYQTVARMNGRRVPVLVDTGATSVSINMSLARKLGISVSDKDFVHKAQTANGVVKIAKAKINDIRIGGIVLDGVEAVVIPDKALSTTLLGMSFLNRLSKYQVENGEMKLVQ